MANYKEIEDSIRRNEPFKHGNSMTGVIDYIDGSDKDRFGIFGEDDVDETYYCIYSYSTLIYAERMEANGKRWLDDKKYSSTTSRRQNLIRRVKGME